MSSLLLIPCTCLPAAAERHVHGIRSSDRRSTTVIIGILLSLRHEPLFLYVCLTNVQALACFKALHRARKQVFDGDVAALNGVLTAVFTSSG